MLYKKTEPRVFMQLLEQPFSQPTSINASNEPVAFCAADKVPNKKKSLAHHEKNLAIASLFSGAGGMDIGFEKAGFKSVWANEYDKTIAPSFKKYFPKTAFDGRSICDIPTEDLPNNVIGVIGGPSCQSWSEAGARRGIVTA